ncbi:MAG: histidine kinase [Bacteroidota bacterium]
MKIKPIFSFLLIILTTKICALEVNEPIRIDKILINNSQRKLNLQNNTITLKTFEKTLILEFANPKKGTAIYFYRINNTSFWHQSKFPIVQFHEIQGGSHLLEVKSKADNIFSKTSTFKIEKEEAFYQKWWFWPSIGAYILLLFGIAAYLFFLYDFRNKLKVQYIRNRIASDLHDEVGSNLNSIAIFIEVMKKKVQKVSPELMNILDKISSNSEETVSLMRDTVWSINPINDSAEKLFDRMKSHGYETLTAKNIKLTFQNTVEIVKLEIGMEQRRNLYLIYKEAINNILKHAKASLVNVNIWKENNKIFLNITDDGIGFDRSQIFEGNGLKNFENRGVNNNIEVRVDSELKKGTTVEVVIKV